MSNFKEYLRQAINEQVGEQQMGGDCYYQLAICIPGNPPQACWQLWCDGEQVSSGRPNGQPPACCMAKTCDCRMPDGGPFPPKAEVPGTNRTSKKSPNQLGRDDPSMFGS